MEDFRVDAQTKKNHVIHETPKQIWLIFKNEKNEIIDLMPTSFGGMVYGQFVRSPVVYDKRIYNEFSSEDYVAFGNIISIWQVSTVVPMG